MQSHYRSLIEETAKAHGLDAHVLEAIVWTESSDQADAFRYEPMFAARYQVASHPIYQQWPVRAVASSYGLCQIMLPTAYELGFRFEWPEELFPPPVNLHYGGKYLQACFRYVETQSGHEDLTATLCCYNGGRNKRALLPRPPNLAYALRVRNRLAQLT